MYLSFLTIREYQHFRQKSVTLLVLNQEKNNNLSSKYLSSINFLKQNIQETLNLHSSIIVNEQKFDINQTGSQDNYTQVDYLLSLEAKYLDLITLIQDLNKIIRRITYLEITKNNDNRNLQIILKTQSLVTK